MPIPTNPGTVSRHVWAVRSFLIAAIIGWTGGADLLPGQAGVPPALLSDPTEAREFARKNLPPGVKPGDILTDQPRYPEGDVAGVYRAALDVIYKDGNKSPRVVVLSQLAEGRSVGCKGHPCPFVPDHKSRIDTLTLQDFRRATLTRRGIRKDFEYRLPISLLTTESRRTLSETGQTLVAGVNRGSSLQEHPFWLGFMYKYRRAWGITTLTQPGFNPARTEAILQVSHNCGTHCSSTELMLLRKSKRNWRVVERMPEVSSDIDMGHKDLRFRGVGAKQPLFEVRAKYVADSIKKMQLPRVVRGAVTNSDTGEPIALARVSISAGNTPNTPWTQTYSDDQGRYLVRGLPVGGTVISVYCPKTTRRAGDILSDAGADIQPGTDTTVDFSVAVRMCDDPLESGLSPRPRRLSSPPPPLMNPADIAAARATSYPSAEEAAIYTAVLNGMWGPTPGQTTLVASETRSLCSAADCADRYRRRIRIQPEVILSTMEDFLSVRHKRLSLRPDFTAQSDLVSSYATRSDVILIGDSAMRYLEKEANFSASAYVGGQPTSGYWDLIQKAYPNVRGLVSFSAIAFSPRRKQALVEMTRADINGFMPSDIFVLNNVAGEWRIVARF